MSFRHLWFLLRAGVGAAALVALPLGSAAAAAQQPAAADTLRLGMDDAVRIASARNPELRLSLLEVEAAEAEAREARGGLLPQVSSTTGYTRDVVSANPFAGTRALGQLGGGAPTGWLFHNEQARTDGDPSNRPISLERFQERQEAAFREAGVSPDDGGNPFAVPNQFQAGLSLQQPLWAPGAAAQVRVARAARDATAAGARRQLAATADSVRRAYLGALLSRERAAVFARSVERTRASVAEAERRVAAGVAPVFERLSAEVELGNLLTDRIEAEAAEQQARDRLLLAIGLAPAQSVALTDALRVDDGFRLADTPLAAALGRALERRADVEEARLAVVAQEARVAAARAAYRPSVDAFADVNYQGNVPDDRSRAVTNPLQPFEVEEERRGVFSGDFWDLGVAAGVRLQWNVFAGGAQRAQADRTRVGARQARIRLEQLRDLVRFDVESALRELRAARDRARIQEANAALAERNYEMVRARVVQGVSTPLERREASDQLDRSRLALLQAVHDYLAARSRFHAAVGEAMPAAWREVER
jgi:outer membrane protein